MVRGGADLTPLKLVLTLAFDVGHNHGQHLFVNVNSRYSVGHTLPPGGSGKRAATYINQGRGLSPLPPREHTTPHYSFNHARSGPDTPSASTYPLPVRPRRSNLLPHYFSVIFKVSRAAGPTM